MIIEFKATVVIAAVVGALVRVFRIGSTAATRIGRAVDGVVVFLISIFCALTFLDPFMTATGIPRTHEAIIAMMLALSSEMIVSKFLKFVQGFEIGPWIEGFLKSRGWKKGEDQ